MTGETLSHYRVLERLGEGATSVVYKAEDLALGRPVALKLLPPGLAVDYGAIARFHHEARTASSLSHPNICTIYEIGEHQGRQFIAMEFLEGQVLSKLISGRPIESYRLLEIAIQITDGLAAAHAEGVIHQDVKPANIFVTGRDHVKLLDFGLAVLIPAGTAGESGSSVPWLAGAGGTAPYMSPEQASGEQLDTRSDLFSFGVTLYEMASGRRAFVGGTTAALMEAIRSHMPVDVRSLNPNIPEELHRIIEKSLEKNRKLRYQTASDMGADLRRLKRDLDTQTRTFVSPARGHRPARPIAPLAAATATPPRRLAAATVGIAAVSALVYASFHVPDAPPLPHAAVEPIPAAAILEDPDAPSAAPQPDVRRPAAPTAVRRSPTARAAADDRVGRLPSAAIEMPRRVRQEPVDSPRERAAVDDSDSRRAWGAQQLEVARSKVALQLYDQAIASLTELIREQGASDAALEAYMLMASIHEIRDKREDAIATYLDVSTRFRDSPRAPEALLRMGDVMLRSRRRGKEAEALKIYNDVASDYASTPWAARALMAKADLEERMRLHQRDDLLGTSVPSALVTYRRLVSSYPGSAERADALWKLAQIYQRVKRYDLAAETLTELAERYPASGHDAWFAAAELYDKRLKVDSSARAAYARVPSTSEKFEEAQKRLARN
jgi:TolA-binding protein